MDGMTPEQKRNYKKAEFRRKYERYWLIYLALFGTAVLSGISGMILPLQADMQVTIWTILAGAYYAIGFLTNGEGAAYFWFDKIVDQDKDNDTQKVIAWGMLVLSVATILTTALACAEFIAYVVGALDRFQTIPEWAQTWVVAAIPIMWVANFVAGTTFKAVSDEAAAERDSRAIIRNAMTQIAKDKADAKAEYWKKNAPRIAQELGEMEAQEEIENMAMRLKNRPARPQDKPGQTKMPQVVSYAAETENVQPNPTSPAQKRD